MQDDRLWQAVLGEIELSVSRGNYVTWFKNTRLLRHKDDVLTIGVPNVFIKQIAQTHIPEFTFICIYLLLQEIRWCVSIQKII